MARELADSRPMPNQWPTRKEMTEKAKGKTITITPLNFAESIFDVEGTAPYVQHKFSEKARKKMLADQQILGGAKGKKREPRNIEEEYRNAIHVGEDGSYGIPCSAFRSAMIDACRAAGFVMTKAKMSVFCLQDVLDEDEGVPLVRIHGEPEMNESAVRLDSGVASIAIRPMWKEWTAAVRLSWDADQFSMDDVANLLERAGAQVGIGEGRPFSPKSHGMGWGTFRIKRPE